MSSSCLEITAEFLAEAVHAESCYTLSDAQVNLLLLCGHRMQEGLECWHIIKTGGEPEQLQEDIRMLEGWVEARECKCYLTKAGEDFLWRAMCRMEKGGAE